MAAVAAEIGDEVNFVGVGGAASLADMQAFVNDLGVDGFPQVNDEDGSIWRSFGITSQPAFAFIDDDGTIEIHRGAMSEAALTERAAALAAS